jgi:hypothetical protein
MRGENDQGGGLTPPDTGIMLPLDLSELEIPVSVRSLPLSPRPDPACREGFRVRWTLRLPRHNVCESYD